MFSKKNAQKDVFREWKKDNPVIDRHLGNLAKLANIFCYFSTIKQYIIKIDMNFNQIHKHIDKTTNV